MAQLVIITMGRAVLLYRRWPYHAKVIKRLEQNSNPTVLTGTGICMMESVGGRKGRRGAGRKRLHRSIFTYLLQSGSSTSQPAPAANVASL